MYHYFSSITNVHGDALTGFFAKCVDTVSGDVVALYADTNLTPIVSVSGLANAAQVDSDGNVDFYVASGTYHLDIYQTDGTSLVKRISNVPMIENLFSNASSGSATNSFGPQSGTATDSNFYLENTKNNSILNFRQWTSGVSTLVGSITGALGTGIIQDAAAHVFTVSSATIAKIAATGTSFGPQGGTAADSTFALDNTNTNSILNFRKWASGVATVIGSIKGASGTGILYDAVSHIFTISSATIATIASTGVTLASGKSIFSSGGKPLVDAAGNILATASIGFNQGAGAGGSVTQITSRTSGVTQNTPCGQITLVSAAGSTSWQTFTVTNSAVAATDVVRVNQASGTDKYMVHVTRVAAGAFDITFATTGGTTTEQPKFNFIVLKGQTT
jgi:hypothetical protein